MTLGAAAVLELLDPVAAVCEASAALLLDEADEPIEVLTVVETAVDAAAANPAVIVTICPPSSEPPFEKDVVLAEEVDEESTCPRTVPLQVPLSELKITQPGSTVSLSPSPSSESYL